MGKQIENSLHYPLNIDDHQQMETEILKPLKYFSKHRGTSKSIFFKFIGHWSQISQDVMQKVGGISELAVDQYLLYDDIVDSSPRRRNLPSTFTVYGVSRTSLAVEYSFYHILDMLEELYGECDQLLVLILKSMPKIFAGVGLEAYRRKHNIIPTPEEDFHTAYLLFCIPLIFGAKVVTNCTAKKRDMKKLLIASGLYLHVYDDYRNLHCTDYMKTKGFCDDIREGKCTFPMMHAINTFPEESKVIRQILRERTDSVEKKRQCLAILEKCGSFEYTKNIMNQLLQIIYEELDKIDDHPPMLRKFFELTVIPTLGILS